MVLSRNFISFFLGLFIVSNLLLTVILFHNYHEISASSGNYDPYGSIVLKDPNLRAEVVFNGLKFPTSFAFLDRDDILVLQEDNGTVRRIVNGNMLPEPLVHVNIATEEGKGMLGIAVAKHDNGPTYVFLYFTETSGTGFGNTQPDENVRLYRYQLKDNKLIDAKLLLDLGSPSTFHNGGKILIGPDQHVYLVVGELNNHHTQAQNFQEWAPPDRSSAILRLTQDGEPVKGGNFLGDVEPLNEYYAYGIRNSFGMAFDPITGKLWDTENGDRFGDEINIIEPGFNSGYRKIQGIWFPDPLNISRAGGIAPLEPKGLVDFGGKGKYSPPEFSWFNTLGPTAPSFLNSDKLGEPYRNDMFVADFRGDIFHFDMNETRTGLFLEGSLADKVANSEIENEDIKFGTGFKGITDMQVGSDGQLYVLSYYFGAIFKILRVT
jgi:glucose/arabinose dehydrogenase